MIDIALIRTNPELVKENIKKKFQDRKLPLVDEVLELDAKRRRADLRRRFFARRQKYPFQTGGGADEAGRKSGGGKGQARSSRTRSALPPSKRNRRR